MALIRKLISLISYIAFLNLFLYHTPGPLAVSLFFVGSTIFLVSLFFEKSKYQSIATILTALIGLIATSTFTIINRDQGFVQFVAILTSCILLGFLTYTIASGIPFIRSLLEFLAIPFKLLAGYIGGGAKLAIAFPEAKGELKGNTKYLQYAKTIGLGLVVGLPIVFVLINLFSSADPIYASLIKKYLTFKTSEELIFRTIFSVVAGFVLIPLFKMVIPKSALTIHAKLYDRRRAFIGEMTVVISMVALALFSFLAVQWKYIFISVTKETDLSAFGVKTYSEYVTRGFMELLFISLILYGLIWIGLIILRGAKDAGGKWLKIAQLVVLFEFAIYLISIARRIWLYQTHHGWSLVRIYGGFFLLWVAIIATTLFLRHISKKRWVLYELGLTGALLFIFCFFNAEKFIATTHPPTVNNRIDYVYLSRMSADGYVGWKKAYQYAESTLQLNDNLPFLDANARRENFYAGSIINELLIKHHELVYEYGSDEQIVAYEKLVLAPLVAQHRQFLRELEASIAPALLKNDPTQNKTTQELELEKGLQRQKLLDEQLSELEKGKKMDEQAFVLYSYYYPPNSQRTCSIIEKLHALIPFPERYSTGFCAISFYELTTDKHFFKERTGLNKLFNFNVSRSLVFTKLQNDILLTNLLQLEQIYFKSLDKITKQPPEERDFEVDISFNTPFL